MKHSFSIWLSLGHPRPLKSPLTAPKILERNFYNCQFQTYNYFFPPPLNIIPMRGCKYIVLPYSNKYVYHVYGSYQSILWSLLKNRTPKMFSNAYFGQPVSESWLRIRSCNEIYKLQVNQEC